MSESIFFNYKNDVQPSQGCILVSEPHLPDVNFDRTVILMCKHDDEGSFGFVLNKKSNLKLHELLATAEGIHVPVYLGGPVEQNTLHFVHRDNDITDAEELMSDLYWGGNFELMLERLRNKMIDDNSVKFFLGYSGWAAGQLIEEIEQNSWMVFQPDNSEFIFNTDHNSLWKKVLQDMGGRFSMYSKYPQDPRLN